MHGSVAPPRPNLIPQELFPPSSGGPLPSSIQKRLLPIAQGDSARVANLHVIVNGHRVLCAATLVRGPLHGICPSLRCNPEMGNVDQELEFAPIV